ncbi:MAG: peptidyl-prolyl cis-trans isomerase [Candidatus Omnitrophota bacterium]
MRDIVFSALNLVLLIFIVFLLLFSMGGKEAPSPIPVEKMRELAATYSSQGLYEQAIDEYQQYLNVAKIPVEQRANILYTIGNIYLDNLEQYEKALGTFLQISQLYPQTKAAPTAEKRMVKCYEALKRGFDAQKKLQQVTDLEPEEKPGTGPVAAQIGEKTITLDQIEREIAQMPDYMRKNYESPEKKKEYLRSKIFQDLLYDKALRKEYNKDAEVRKQLRQMEKSLLASKIYEEEVREKVAVSPSDIDLYYQAHKEDYIDPLTVKIAHIQLDSQEKADEAKKKLDEGMEFEKAVKEFSTDNSTKDAGGVLGDVRKGVDSVPRLGKAPEIASALLEMEEGAVGAPMKGPSGYHIFRIAQKTPERQRPLEEVKSQVEARVRSMKEQERQQQLLDELLKAENVKINDQVFGASAPSEESKTEPQEKK